MRLKASYHVKSTRGNQEIAGTYQVTLERIQGFTKGFSFEYKKGIHNYSITYEIGVSFALEELIPIIEKLTR